MQSLILNILKVNPKVTDAAKEGKQGTYFHTNSIQGNHRKTVILSNCLLALGFKNGQSLRNYIEWTSLPSKKKEKSTVIALVDKKMRVLAILLISVPFLASLVNSKKPKETFQVMKEE